mgnify:CR=1 FL=1
MTRSAPTAEPVEENRMTLMDHLRELRTRLIWVLSALVVGTLFSMIFVEPLLRFIPVSYTHLTLPTSDLV